MCYSFGWGRVPSSSVSDSLSESAANQLGDRNEVMPRLVMAGRFVTSSIVVLFGKPVELSLCRSWSSLLGNRLFAVQTRGH